MVILERVWPLVCGLATKRRSYAGLQTKSLTSPAEFVWESIIIYHIGNLIVECNRQEALIFVRNRS